MVKAECRLSILPVQVLLSVGLLQGSQRSHVLVDGAPGPWAEVQAAANIRQQTADASTPPAAAAASGSTNGTYVGYDSRVTPFYADPVFDAAHDAELVWHAEEQTWWVVYLQNRQLLQSMPLFSASACVSLCVSVSLRVAHYILVGSGTTHDAQTSWGMDASSAISPTWAWHQRLIKAGHGSTAG
jgi:hypothetical protein